MAKKCSTRSGCNKPRSRYWKKSLGLDWFDHNNQGESEPIETTEDGKQAILVLGDSQHRSAGSTAGATSSSGIIEEFDGAALIELTAADISTAADGSWVKQYANNYNSVSTFKTVVAARAVGGSSFAPFTGDLGQNWSEDGDLFDPAIEFGNDCLSFLSLTKFKAIFVSLGSKDILEGTASATVETHARSFFTRLQAAFPNTKIYILSPGRVGGANGLITANIAAVKQFILDIVEENENIELSSNSGLYTSWALLRADGLNVHIDTTGLNVLGDQISNQVASAETNREVRQIQSYFRTALSDPHKLAYKTFIETLQDLGVWDWFDSYQIYRASTSFNGLVELKNSTWPLAINSPVFSANNCYTSNTAASRYIRSNWIQTTCKRASSINDIHISAKVGTNSTAAGVGAHLFGARGASARLVLIQSSSSFLQYVCGDSTLSSYVGHTKIQDNTRYCVARNGGTKYLFGNSVQLDSVAVASVAELSQDIVVGGVNNQGTPESFISCQFQSFRVGRYLTAEQLALVDAAEDTLLTALAS
jgi:hypothetical protein